MNHRMRVTSNDRLTINGQFLRLRIETDTGYAFENVDGAEGETYFSFEDFDALLSDPDVTFQPGYFLIGQIEARMHAGAEASELSRQDIQDRVVYRFIWVSVSMHFLANEGMTKTDQSIEKFMPQMEAHVNALARAAQQKWKAPRAGRTSLFRDPPSTRTLRTWLKRYEKGDYSYLALMPRTHRSGNRENRFCLAATRLLGDCVSTYLSRQRLSKKQVADLCKTRFRKVNEDREAEGKPALPVPSRRAVERAIKKLDPYFTYVQRQAAHSDSIRPLNPMASGHPFRFDPATDSGASGHPI
ncbi:hypothetical protein [Leisingera sp. M523]|uniref:hypothetical protein n=1 Tax=Leisingera sp. M523 TaxID=2867013 RepID=UPI0021A7FF4C|nr:hypothetical protein [Leisingera sp. M523]UWQ29058.1 hypothetical protein K3557_00150 [Leisingera sp. M523]